ncbi:MAG TPA: PilZ domain-containing protein [Pseudobdellovibrionaceae bacterium]|nr:PilZ domain-containing protein [Pseudobdellovibrionaceae bacterium]
MKTQERVWVFYNSTTKNQSAPLNTIQAQIEILKFKYKEINEHLIWSPGWDQWENLMQFLKSNQKYFIYSKPPEHANHGLKTPPLPENINDMNSETQTFTGTKEIEPSKLTPSDSPFTEINSEETQSGREEFGFYNDFNGDDLSLSDIQKSEKKIKKAQSNSANRRTFSRLDLKLEVFLVSRSHTFKTYSQNISVGGTLLIDDVPKDFFKSSFDLLIINPLDPNPSTGRLLFKAKIIGELLNTKRLRFIEVDKIMTEKLKALLNAYKTYQKMTHHKVS